VSILQLKVQVISGAHNLIFLRDHHQINWFSVYRSFGCTIVELLTGLPPWGELDPILALFKIHTESLPSICKKIDCSEELESFIHDCCHRDPKRRPTAQELLEHPWLTLPLSGEEPKSMVMDLKELLDQYSDDIRKKKESGSSTLIVGSNQPIDHRILKKWLPPVIQPLEVEDPDYQDRLQTLLDRLQEQETFLKSGTQFSSSPEGSHVSPGQLKDAQLSHLNVSLNSNNWMKTTNDSIFDVCRRLILPWRFIKKSCALFALENELLLQR
jgi:serine/threonine protein kinase